MRPKLINLSIRISRPNCINLQMLYKFADGQFELYGFVVRSPNSLQCKQMGDEDGEVMSTDPLIDGFRISAAMRPYVLRLRPRGQDFDFLSDPDTTAIFNEGIKEMESILIARRVPIHDAHRANQRSLEAAVDIQFEDLRRDSIKTMNARRRDAQDCLIDCLRDLADAIAKLAPNSKSELKIQVSSILRQPVFDTEVFIDAIGAIAAALPKASPRCHAENALKIIYPAIGQGRRSPIVDYWEAMRPTTRGEAERILQRRKHVTSTVGWLNAVADLLNGLKQQGGAPHSILQPFAFRVASIWRDLRLEPGLAFYPGNKFRSACWVKSRFQRYCDAALAAFGDARSVSGRQVRQAKDAFSTNS